MQCVDVGLGIFVDDERGDDYRATFVGGADAIDRKTAGKTRNGAEKGLEGFGEMVRDIVLIDLAPNVLLTVPKILPVDSPES